MHKSLAAFIFSASLCGSHIWANNLFAATCYISPRKVGKLDYALRLLFGYHF